MNIFVFSSNVFGGHEMMATKIVNSLLLNSSQEILILVNNSIANKVSSAIHNESVKIVSVNFCNRKFENLTGYLNPYIYVNFLKYKKYVNGAYSITLINGGISANHSISITFLLLAKFFNIKSFVYYPMYHTPNELQLNRLKSKSYIHATRRVLDLVDELITIDEVWKDRLLDNYKQKKEISIIHNYIDGKNECFNIDKNKNKNKEFVIGYVGRFDEYQKGLDIYLDFISKISLNTQFSIRFEFVGDGPYKDFFINEVVKYKSDKIEFKFYGWVENVHEIMMNFDVLLITSRCEGIPTVLIEAILSNVNIVAFDIPGISKILSSENLAKPFDVDQLISLINLSQNGELGFSYNNSYVLSLFDINRFNKEVLLTYE